MIMMMMMMMIIIMMLVAVQVTKAWELKAPCPGPGPPSPASRPSPLDPPPTRAPSWARPRPPLPSWPPRCPTAPPPLPPWPPSPYPPRAPPTSWPPTSATPRHPLTPSSTQASPSRSVGGCRLSLCHLVRCPLSLRLAVLRTVVLAGCRMVCFISSLCLLYRPVHKHPPVGRWEAVVSLSVTLSHVLSLSASCCPSYCCPCWMSLCFISSLCLPYRPVHKHPPVGRWEAVVSLSLCHLVPCPLSLCVLLSFVLLSLLDVA